MVHHDIYSRSITWRTRTALPARMASLSEVQKLLADAKAAHNVKDEVAILGKVLPRQDPLQGYFREVIRCEGCNVLCIGVVHCIYRSDADSSS